MPLAVARTFLLVCLHEGKTVSEYQQMAGVPQANMSRHLLDLGSFARSKQPGMGLVKAEMDPMDMRVRRYWITPKARDLKGKLESIIDG